MSDVTFIATAFSADTGISWWQSLGGFAAVLGLLLVFLKLLGRLNGRLAGDAARLEKVWPLGPKREIQVLRLGDEVHYVYRHDGAMVLLKNEPHGEFVRKHQEPVTERNGTDSRPPWRRLLRLRRETATSEAARVPGLSS